DDWASVLGVLDADYDRVVYFESLALPFGASSALTGFNRAARAPRIIMSRLLYLVNTSFFDDYCQLEVEALTGSADQTALDLLALLGWEVSGGDKLKPFDVQFTVLGAVVSFEEAQRGLIRVRNKPGRVDDVLGLFHRLREDPVANARILPSLKGRQSGAKVTQQVLDAVDSAVDMNRRVLGFVDNEAAKSALIRNYSPLVDATAMLSEVASWDMFLGCLPWYCRVPSKSNIADAASRLSFGECEESFRKIEPMY
ncbi:unnamed protein product, partial [Symbiodinium necroappetens]